MNTDSNNMRLGIIAMAATAFLWSIAGLFIKYIDWHPFAIAGARSFIASCVILVYLRRPQFHFSFPQLAAAVANAATMMLFVAANKTTTAANAIILQYLAPVLTAFLGAALLKERVRVEQWAALALSAVGIVVLFGDRLGGGMLLGNILALCSGVTFSLYFIFMRRQKDGSPLESNLLSHWITAVLCLVVTLVLPMPEFSAQSLAAVALLGVVQIGVPAILFAAAIKRVSAASANLIAVIEPVFNPLWVFLAIGERPGSGAIMGGLIIVAAVTGASIVSARRAAVVRGE